MKIVAFEAENIKHLRVVNINPDGSLIIIGGDNGAGKTCVLDSIEYALNGAGSVPSKPIRNGQKKACVILDLGDIRVARTFTENGTNLVVKNKDGATFSSPQAMLDKLKGQLAFDPLDFSRMDVKKQSEVLMQLVGLNFDKINAQYKCLFSDRTNINRRGKETRAQLDSMNRHENVSDKEVSIQELSIKYADMIEHNKRIEHDRSLLSSETKELKNLEKQVSILKKSIKQRQKTLDVTEEVDVEGIYCQMSDAESMNIKIRENNEYDKVNSDLIKLRKQSESLSKNLIKIEQDKVKTLAEVKFPIKGLAIDDDCVTFEGIPFAQCSTAQKIKISVAIGLAMNPKLRVLLIREGSLLDATNLAMIAKMAEEADAQIWMERVSKGEECQVIIEDGAVIESETSSV